MKEFFQFKLTGDKKHLVKGRKGRAMRRYLKNYRKAFASMVDMKKFEEGMIKSHTDMVLYGESIINPNDYLKTP